MYLSKEITKNIVESINELVHCQPVEHPICEFSYIEHKEKDDKIQLGIKKKVIQLETYSSKFKQNQKKELKKFGIDVHSVIEGALIEETKLSVSRTLLNLIKKHSVFYKYKYNIWNKIIEFLFSLFGKRYEKRIRVKSFKDLTQPLLEACMYIRRETRIGEGNTVIMSPRLFMKLEEHPAFVYSENNTVSLNKQLPPIHFLGTLHGLRVYINNYTEWNNEDVYVFRVVKQNEEGIHFFYKDQHESETIRYNLRASMVSIGDNSHKNYRRLRFKINDNE